MKTRNRSDQGLPFDPVGGGDGGGCHSYLTGTGCWRKATHFRFLRPDETHDDWDAVNWSCRCYSPQSQEGSQCLSSRE